MLKNSFYLLFCILILGGTADATSYERPIGARCVPNIKPNSDGKYSGFKCLQINPNYPNNGFIKAGIKEGDVILAVDSDLLEGHEKIFEIFERISKGTYSSIQIQRGDKTLFLTKAK